MYPIIYCTCTYVCTYGRDQKKVNIAIRNTCVLRTYYSAQLLCVITENTAITKNNYVAQVRYVVPLGSLSVLFKHWLNFDLVSSMPLNRRWLTYVEISWPMSQLISPVNHTSRWKCSLFLTKTLNHAFSLAKWERSWRYKLVATYVGRLRADNERNYPSTLWVS